MRGSTDAVPSPDLTTLTLLATRAQSAFRGDGDLDAAARETLERELRAAIEELAPAYHAAPEYCRATEALTALHLALHSERLMAKVGADL